MFRRFAASAVVLACLIAGCGSSPAPLHGGRAHPTNFGQPPAGDYGLSSRSFLAPLTIEGYDAVTLTNIPRAAQAVGCYVSGRFANCGAAQLLFPHARLVTIATFAAYPGVAKIIDTEPGDATPSQDAGFIRHELALHVYRPGVYADSAEMGAVQADLAGIPRGEYVLMVADWDGRPAIPSGFDAKQWFSNCCVDRDSFTSGFFAPPPKPPAPKPKPKPKPPAPQPKPEPKPAAPTYDQEFDSGFQRGFTVRWDQLHHRKAPQAHRLTFGPGFNPGYTTGWRAAR